jgi:hypothetical protein
VATTQANRSIVLPTFFEFKYAGIANNSQRVIVWSENAAGQSGNNSGFEK